MGLGQGFTKKPLRRGRGPSGGKQEVNRLTSFVDRSIEIGPTTLHLDIGLIHPPRPIGQSQMRPKALLQLGGVCLKPPENRRVIDSYPAILKHQLKVPVADGEHQIPPHRPQDDLARELPPLEPLTLNQHCHSGESLSNPYYALSSRCQKSLQQNPLSTIERIERGEPVSTESLDRVAEALRQPPGAFTASRTPSTTEEALQRLEESAALFAETVTVPVKPLRGHRQIAELARSDLIIVDGSRMGDSYDADIDTLREWLDLTSFILATEDNGSIIQTDADPVKRRTLYDDVLTCVRDIERRGHAVALAGTYQIEPTNKAMPKATAALVGFFPKLTDPAAINRRTLFAPVRVDWAAAWSQFCAEGGTSHPSRTTAPANSS
jgi:hypothetical protein